MPKLSSTNYPFASKLVPTIARCVGTAAKFSIYNCYSFSGFCQRYWIRIDGLKDEQDSVTLVNHDTEDIKSLMVTHQGKL